MRVKICVGRVTKTFVLFVAVSLVGPFLDLHAQKPLCFRAALADVEYIGRVMEKEIARHAAQDAGREPKPPARFFAAPPA
jgi:hypothetical protein